MQLKKRIGAFILAITVIASSQTGIIPVKAKDDAKNENVFNDSFDDSTMEERYKSNGGTFQIKDGILTINGDGVVGLQNYLWVDAVYEFDIDVSEKSNDDWAGVQFDKETATAQRDAAGYMLYVRGNGSVELYTGKDGVLKKAAVPDFSDKKIHIKIETQAGRIAVYVNEGQTPLFEVQDNSYDYGYFSMINYGNGKACYDNLKITAKAGDGNVKKVVISVPGDSIAIGTGETMKLKAMAIPTNADNTDVIWEVTDVYKNPSDLAVISEDGYLTAGQVPGVIRINVKSALNPDISDYVEMAIVNEPVQEYETQVSSKEYVCDFSVADADYQSYRQSCKIEDEKLKLIATGITMTNLENHVWNSGVYEWDMDLHDAKEWAGFMICKTNPEDIWDNSGYAFIVTPSGDWQVLKGGDGMIRSGHIDGFVNQENHYRIEKTGSRIYVYINQETDPIVTVDDAAYGKGYVSFIASTPWDRTDEVWFDNVKVVPKKEVVRTVLYEQDFSEDMEVFDSPYAASNTEFVYSAGKLAVTPNFWNGITYLKDKTFGSGTYSFDMNVNDSEWASFLFCKNEQTDTWDNSGYMFLVQPNGNWQLLGAAAGTQTGTIQNFENKENHFEIVKNDDSLEIYINQEAAPVVSITDSQYQNGYISYGVNGWGKTAYYDNLIIKDDTDTAVYEDTYTVEESEMDFVGQGLNVSCADGKLNLSKTDWGNGIAYLKEQSFGSGVYEFDLNVNDFSDWASVLLCKEEQTDTWDNSGYMFLVKPNGEWQLIGLKNGNQSGTITGFENKENHYKIVKTNASIAIYFNEEKEPIVLAEDTQYMEGYVSFAASGASGGTAYVDNVCIYTENESDEDEDKTKIESLYIAGEYGTQTVACKKSLKITAYAEPYVNTEGLLEWTVEPSNLADIDVNGVLTAGDAVGEVTVTATTEEGISAQTTIKIQESVEVDSVYAAAEKNQRIMGVGKTVSMNAYCRPYQADNGEIVWSVMNTDESETELAVITEDGKLTANAKGTVRVRAALKSDLKIYSDWIMTIGEVTTNGKSDMPSMNMSFFTHYVAGLTADKDGTVITDANDIADSFDAEAYADEMAAMGVEYIVFTSYHYAMVCLYDSQVMKDWGMDGHYTNRDMIGDMINAVNEKGINVVLYVHPFDGYDFETEEEGIKTGWGTATRGKGATAPYYEKDFDYEKWNNFINDIYGEIMEKYGDRICGIWSDEGNLWDGMAKAVDFPRLLETIYSYNPNITTIQNNHGFYYGFDYSTWESWKMPELNDVTGNSMRTYANRIPNPVISSDWWAGTRKTSENTVKLTGKILYRYQAMQAGASIGCGIQWSAGCYAGAGAEYQSGVTESMEIMNAYLNPVAWTIKDTLASTSYVTGDNRTIKNIGWGTAVKSTDDTREYLHILNPDDKSISGNTITLPAPKDYKIFSKAYMAVNNHPVTVEQTEDALILTLSDTDTWNDVDTVIELLVDVEKTKENQENHKEESSKPVTDNGNASEDTTTEVSDESLKAPQTGDTLPYKLLILSAVSGAVCIVGLKNKKQNKV